MTGRAYVHGGQEMSELLDKQMNAQKKSLKNTSGVHASSHKPTKKHVMKMKAEKNDKCLK